MTISDFLMISAVLVGPILAVQVQKWIERWQESKQRKQKIFKTLMATRGATLSLQHVEALNMIDLEFSNRVKKERPVIEAWRVYLDHLNNYSLKPQDEDYQIRLERWNEKSWDLLVNLLYSMSKTLGYQFDKVALKKGAYRPQGHANLELENGFIRRGLVGLFLGNKSLPVSINPSALDQAIDLKNEETEEQEKSISKYLLD